MSFFQEVILGDDFIFSFENRGESLNSQHIQITRIKTPDNLQVVGQQRERIFSVQLRNVSHDSPRRSTE